MNVSGILTLVPPDRLREMEDELSALEGVDVHFRDAQQGKLILTQEAQSISDEVAGLKRIQAVPGVIMAEMVYHYFAEDQENIQEVPPGLVAEEDTEGVCVPGYLNQ
jgi:nitrate reductase NapD